MNRVAAMFMLNDNLPYIKGEVVAYIYEADWSKTLEEIISQDSMKNFFALEVAEAMLEYAPISMAPVVNPNGDPDNPTNLYPTGMAIEFQHIANRLGRPEIATVEQGTNIGLVDGKALVATDFISLATGKYYGAD